jgi:UDP-N-acetylglucosamine 2-epimerase
LTKPLSYSESIYLLSKCLFCFSDSGGLQEEAIILKKRCLIPSDYTPHNYYLAKNANCILKLDDKNYKSKAKEFINSIKDIKIKKFKHKKNISNFIVRVLKKKYD